MPEVMSGTIFPKCVYVGSSPIRGGPNFLPELWGVYYYQDWLGMGLALW